MARQFLKPKKGPAKKLSKFIAFDFEWNPDPNNTTFTIGSMYDGKEVIRLESPGDFLKHFLVPKYVGFIAFAHYGSGADFQWLFPCFAGYAKQGYEIQIANAGGKILFVKIKRGKRVWYLRDSYKLVTLALNRAAKSFGLGTKLDTYCCRECNGNQFIAGDRCPKCFGSGKGWDRTADELWEYNVHDTKLLYRVMERFGDLAQSIGFSVQRTTGACALDLFCRRYLEQPLINYPNFSTEIHPAVFGGRVEIFRHYSEKPIFAHDVNSMYPFVMREGEFVSEMPYRVSQTKLSRIPDGWQGVARCEVNVPESMVIPVLCTKSHAGKLIFPVGRFSGVWSIYELKYAASLGVEIGTLEYAIIGKAKPIFRGYVDQLYGLRQTAKENGDGARSQVLKLMLNSLYGKTLERGIYSKIEFDSDGDAIEETELNPPKNYLPLIGVDITARARVLLHKAMCLVDPDALLYCDTDSIYTEQELPKSEQHPTELGKWDCEVFDSGSFILPKVYKVVKDGEISVKAKGIKLWGPSDYEYLTGKALEYTTTATFKTKGVKAGHARKLSRRLRAKYDKREVLANGRTKPLLMNGEFTGGLGNRRKKSMDRLLKVKLETEGKEDREISAFTVAWNPKDRHVLRWGLYRGKEKVPRSFIGNAFTRREDAESFTLLLVNAAKVIGVPDDCLNFS